MGNGEELSHQGERSVSEETNGSRAFRYTGEARENESVSRSKESGTQENAMVPRIRTGRGGRVHELKNGKRKKGGEIGRLINGNYKAKVNLCLAILL